MVGIWNRALQKLGAKVVTSETENSVNARACKNCYYDIVEEELRKRAWNFAIKRVQLAASATPPAFGKANYFPLPPDYVAFAPPDPADNTNYRDWQVEADAIVTDYEAPLNIRYVALITDPNLMDALFRNAVSAKMAEQMSEELTQSNSKKAAANIDYKDAIAEARRANAFEKPAGVFPEDEWITARD